MCVLAAGILRELARCGRKARPFWRLVVASVTDEFLAIYRSLLIVVVTLTSLGNPLSTKVQSLTNSAVFFSSFFSLCLQSFSSKSKSTEDTQTMSNSTTETAWQGNYQITEQVSFSKLSTCYLFCLCNPKWYAFSLLCAPAMIDVHLMRKSGYRLSRVMVKLWCYSLWSRHGYWSLSTLPPSVFHHLV